MNIEEVKKWDENQVMDWCELNDCELIAHGRLFGSGETYQIIGPCTNIDKPTWRGPYQNKTPALALYEWLRVMQAVEREEKLRKALERIYALDYTRAGTNMAAYHANKIAEEALNQ